MKLESNLPKRAGLLHTAPVLDIVVLLLIFFLLGSHFTLRSGVEVNLPATSFGLDTDPEAHVITVSKHSPPRIFFNEEEVTIEQLPNILQEQSTENRSVILKADRVALYGWVIQISQIVLKAGCKLSLATDPDPRQ